MRRFPWLTAAALFIPVDFHEEVGPSFARSAHPPVNISEFPSGPSRGQAGVTRICCWHPRAGLTGSANGADDPEGVIDSTITPCADRRGRIRPRRSPGPPRPPASADRVTTQGHASAGKAGAKQPTPHQQFMSGTGIGRPHASHPGATTQSHPRSRRHPSCPAAPAAGVAACSTGS
jgi:hypothetical protein